MNLWSQEKAVIFQFAPKSKRRARCRWWDLTSPAEELHFRWLRRQSCCLSFTRSSKRRHEKKSWTSEKKILKFHLICDAKSPRRTFSLLSFKVFLNSQFLKRSRAETRHHPPCWARIKKPKIDISSLLENPSSEEKKEVWNEDSKMEKWKCVNFPSLTLSPAAALTHVSTRWLIFNSELLQSLSWSYELWWKLRFIAYCLAFSTCETLNARLNVAIYQYYHRSSVKSSIKNGS